MHMLSRHEVYPKKQVDRGADLSFVGAQEHNGVLGPSDSQCGGDDPARTIADTFSFHVANQPHRDRKGTEVGDEKSI